MNSFYQLSDKPVTPTLTANNLNPLNGDDIVLSCSTSTLAVTSYEFRFGGTLLTTTPLNTYRINSATKGTHDGSYTCTALIGTVASELSTVYFLSSMICLSSTFLFET